MTMSYEEAAYEEFVNTIAAELYEEHSDQAIEGFIKERLQSYYESNPKIAMNAHSFLVSAEAQIYSDPTSSLLYSSICTEVMLKSVMLKPIVAGLVHNESISELVSTLLIKQTGVDRFKSLIFKILDEYIGVGCESFEYKRLDSNQSLWKEREIVQNVRNGVSHRAQFCTIADAELSISVAKEFYDLTSRLIAVLGFHFDDRGEIKRGSKGQQSIF
ncbi:hypothetical protein [Neptuniibacter sp.]|uniref:hypothetical protein n=1 Tax=Neptuniibacter sp. TaxID=1962643 RepID=UPI003B5A5B6E